ncbi:DUF4034 domain-containing protein [Arenimonas soli]|uniref:DUF4034 domain-containing protein n=1 Tax=Arenimonas soli TaxID=2269504 RepID=UPI001663BAB4|nr:DUF4034 domain-containing protein [Arenimonas soli]
MRSIRLAAGLLVATSCVQANPTPPPIPPAPSPYRNAPAEVRPYLEQARKADLLPDPMARCLAWPEIPGAQWPDGLVEAHCDNEYAPRLTLDELDKHLREGSIATLEARLGADLERHYADEGFSEIIHAHFFDIGGGVEAGRLTQAWIEAAPESPFAHVARGHWNRGMARMARGGKWASKTPRENFERMHAYGDAAIASYERALELEPRLTEAHAGIIGVANLGGREDAMRNAVRQARELAPACRAWGHPLMVALEPRWGGSYPQMAQFAATLKPFIADRPMAALVAAMPQVALANQLYRAEKWSEAEAVAREATRHTTHIAPYYDAGVAILRQDSGNRWEALMYLLGESRFPPGNAYAARQRGHLIWDLTGDVEWAGISIERAVELEPENGLGQWLLGGIRATQGRVDEAEAAYLEAMRDPEQRRSALTNLSSLLIMEDEIPRAARYVRTLTTEYPDHGWGWFYNALVVIDRKGGTFSPDDEEVMAAFDKFEQTADPGDPDQLRQVQALRDSHRRMREMMDEADAEMEVRAGKR